MSRIKKDYGPWPPPRTGYSTYCQYKNLVQHFRKRMGHTYIPGREEYTMSMLKLYSEIVIDYKERKKLAVAKREKWHKQIQHDRLFARPCFACGSSCDHRHHIIQLQNGGDNHKRNVVPICLPCHTKIHPWMKRK